jgi:hypothetical protein
MITYFYTHVNPNRVKNTYIKGKATMNEYILTEFSIFYKRLIRVELYLKTLIIQKYITTYGDNAYNIIYRYIKTIEQRRNSNDKTFEKIHQSKINNEEKLQQVINKMYISELLNFFVNAVYLKNKRVRNNFFEEPIQTNSTNFQQKCKILKDFRNCIAHCNIKKYTLERAKFIKGLLYFEKLLKCNVMISCDLIEKINNSRKLSVNEILTYIYMKDKNYFKDDKILMLLFDDIALINGYTFQGLPQRKSIIRESFKLLEKIRTGETIEIPKLENKQMKLDLF